MVSSRFQRVLSHLWMTDTALMDFYGQTIFLGLGSCLCFVSKNQSMESYDPTWISLAESLPDALSASSYVLVEKDGATLCMLPMSVGSFLQFGQQD